MVLQTLVFQAVTSCSPTGEHCFSIYRGTSVSENHRASTSSSDKIKIPYFGSHKSRFPVGPDRAQFLHGLPAFESAFSSNLFILLNISTLKTLQHVLRNCQHGPKIVTSVTTQKTTILRTKRSSWKNWSLALPSAQHRSHIKRRLQQFFVAAGTCLPNRCLATIRRYEDKPTEPTLIRHRPYIKQRVQQFFYCYLCWLPRERVYRAVT
jgi:hypothetical protein